MSSDKCTIANRKEEKSREEVEAERKARKAAKLAKKVKPGFVKSEDITKEKSLENGNMSNKESQNQKEENTRNIQAEVKIDLSEKKSKEGDSKTQLSKIENKTVVKENRKNDENENIQSGKEKGEEGKSKAQLRAERRVLQEAQRAAKSGTIEKGLPLKQKQNLPPNVAKQPFTKESLHNSIVKPDDKSVKLIDGILKQQVYPERKTKKSVSWVKPSFFGHLKPFPKATNLLKEWRIKSGQECEDVDPAFSRLGLFYANGLVVGGNARALGLLQSLKKLVHNCIPPEGKDLSRELLRKFDKNFEFIEYCRPPSVSMLNSMRHIRSKCCQFGDQKLPNDEFKKKLLEEIDSFVYSNITLAAKSIASCLRDATRNNNEKAVYMTYGCSSTVNSVLVEMKDAGTKFHVVVVDSHVRPEGRASVRRLTDQGIPCTLVSSEHVSFIIKYVTKVLIGCSALLVNSDVLSRVGTSQVALIAKSRNVPVLAFCETYKCASRPQTDAFGSNELGDPTALTGLEASPSLSGLNIAYDITPASFITAVVTESGMFPCDAAKAILRLKQLDTDE